MACNKHLYDIKKVAYVSADYNVANYMASIAATGFQEIFAQKEGFVLETKGEVTEFTTLNGVRNVDSERIPLRQNGSLKFTRNVDSYLLTNHKELISAGLGNVSDGTITSITVTGGQGSPAVPFVITQDTATLAVGDLIYNSSYGWKAVTSVDSVTPFGCQVDVPLATTISNSTVFTVFRGVDITNPVGNCAKTFNFVLSHDDGPTDDDGSYTLLMGCGVKCEFSLTYEKQLVITFNIMSPDITEVDTAPTGFDGATTDTKGTPVICSFTDSKVITVGTAVTYFPPMFDLGLTITEEPLKAMGGRNNLVGYINRSSLKPKISFDKISTCKAWVAAPRTGRSYSFYQSNFGLYISNGYLTLVDQSVANGNMDTISCEMDANSEASYKVYIVLP